MSKGYNHLQLKPKGMESVKYIDDCNKTYFRPSADNIVKIEFSSFEMFYNINI